MYFWGNENIFAWPLLAVCGLRLSALLVRGHTSQEVAAEERKKKTKEKRIVQTSEEGKENSNQEQSKKHTKKSEECEKIYFKYQLVCRKYSCDKVWRINENEWQQYPIVGRKRFFIQEREGERWDESLKSENTVILVQITRTSPRRILSWKVEWGENYVTTWGQRSGQSEVKWLCINHTTLTFPTSNGCCPWAGQE